MPPLVTNLPLAVGSAPADDSDDDDTHVKTATTPSSASAAFGEDSVRVTATVTALPKRRAASPDGTTFALGDPSPVDGGSVTFLIENSDGVTVRTVSSDTVAAGEAAAAVSLAGLPVGNYTIRAIYTPAAESSSYAASKAEAPATLVVRQSATTVALTSSLNPVANGRSVTFTARVVPEAGGTPTGTVNFYIDGAIPVGSSTLSVVGDETVATFTTLVFHEGVREVSADYVGDHGFLASRTEAPMPQKVTSAAVIHLFPSELMFGDQRVTTTSPGLLVRLSNIGDADLPIAIAINGPHASDFTQTNNCLASLGYVTPTNACTITVTFHPSGAGARSADLTILDVEGEPQVLPLVGEGN